MEKRGRGILVIRGKSAISPLVATMFLILFAMVLGAIVMFAGTEYYEKEFCKGVVIELHKINGKNQICSSEGLINFMLKNSGAVDIDNLQVSFVGENSIDTTSLTNLPNNKQSIIEKMDGSVTYNPKIGGIKEITITPYIKIDDSIKKCSMNELKVFKINPCKQ